MSFNIVIKRYIKEARAEETRRIKVESSKVNIGTGPGNEIQLEGLGVSIKHAIIEKLDDNTFWLTDLNTDGTYVHNNLISKKCQLSNQDEIKIGPYTLVITIPASTEESITILIKQTVEAIEEEEAPSKKEKKVQYVSRYRLSSLFTKAGLSIIGVVLLTGLAVLWMVGADKTPFSPGKLSKAHTKFNNDCTRCHTLAWHTVLDKDCQKCHKTNPHNKNELFTPACVQCHFEHKGNPVLADLEDKFCTQCHSELKIKGYIPSSTYETEILGFNSGHPEFAVVVVRLANQNGDIVRVRLNDKKNLKDNTPINLNHKVHLKPNLKVPDGPPENLLCESCHRVDANGEYTLPIEYERDCKRCHPLEFLDRFSKVKVVVPHEAPDIVRRFLQNYYREYAINNINRLGLGRNVNAVNQLVSSGVRDAEDVLFTKKQCDKCHAIKEIAGGLHEVEKPQIPLRWLPYSTFDHELHAKNLRLSCDSCHEAKTSEKTTDVLIPSIDKCQKCHSSEGGAKTECVLCHQYHERGEPAAIEGTKSIKEILEGK
ncbi:MAG: FHA domain-containing protein [Thermodesulfobacteriota bacterium]